MPRPTPAPLLLVLAASAALTAAACGASVQGVGPRGRGGAGPLTGGALGAARPAVGPDSMMFGRRRDRRPQVSGDGGAARRVCRSGAWPRGWVAVAYERGSDGCPGRSASDSTTMTAVLVRAAGLPLDTRLDICADQPTPPGWSFVPGEAAEDTGACPGAAREGRPSVRRIRRTW